MYDDIPFARERLHVSKVEARHSSIKGGNNAFRYLSQVKWTPNAEDYLGLPLNTG